jgi:hypothetical protein
MMYYKMKKKMKDKIILKMFSLEKEIILNKNKKQ